MFKQFALCCSRKNSSNTQCLSRAKTERSTELAIKAVETGRENAALPSLGDGAGDRSWAEAAATANITIANAMALIMLPCREAICKMRGEGVNGVKDLEMRGKGVKLLA